MQFWQSFRNGGSQCLQYLQSWREKEKPPWKVFQFGNSHSSQIMYFVVKLSVQIVLHEHTREMTQGTELLLPMAHCAETAVWVKHRANTISWQHLTLNTLPPSSLLSLPHFFACFSMFHWENCKKACVKAVAEIRSEGVIAGVEH